MNRDWLLDQMMLAPYLVGRDPLDLTVCCFFGILTRISKLNRILSGKPPSHEEMKEMRDARNEL